MRGSLLHRVGFQCDGPQIPALTPPNSLPSGLLEACPPRTPKTTSCRFSYSLVSLDPAPAAPPAPHSCLQRATQAMQVICMRVAGDAGDTLLALLNVYANIPHHLLRPPWAGLSRAPHPMQRTPPSPPGGKERGPRSLVLPVSHHSSEAFVLTLEGSYLLCVCVCVFRFVCVSYIFRPAHRGLLLLQQEAGLAGGSWHASWAISAPRVAGWAGWQGSPRPRQSRMGARAVEGGVQAGKLASSPHLPHRLPLGYRASPKVSGCQTDLGDASVPLLLVKIWIG